MTNVLVLPENIFKFIQGLHGFIFNLTYLNILDFYEKKPRKTENNKNFKAICAVLDYSKPKIFFVSQPWWPTFFQTPAPLPQLF